MSTRFSKSENRVDIVVCSARQISICHFTLTFFGDSHRDALALCGSKSGRDMDKIAACNFTVAEAACGAPYFEEARLVLVCRKLYEDELKPEKFLDKSCDTACYPNRDHHTFYIAEIVEALERVD